MTSMTMAGGLVGTAPQWRLGEMGQVLKEHMKHKIDSLDQLNLYMQRNDADMLYGSRILAQIDAILDDVRLNGISKDLAVAVESTRPGTIPKNVQSILTSNYTRTHQKETIAALESWKEAGKVGLIVLVVTAILKILSWIMDNGKGYKGKVTTGDVDAMLGKVKEDLDRMYEEEKSSGATDLDYFKDTLKVTAVRRAYAEARDSANKKTVTKAVDRLGVAALRLDKVLADIGAENSLNVLMTAVGKSPFTKLFRSYLDDGQRANPNGVLNDAIAELFGWGLADAVFTNKAATNVFALLPKDMRSAGIRVPNEVVFQVVNARANELNGFFKNLQAGFHAMREMSSQPQDNYDLKRPLQNFGDAIRTLNDVLVTVIPDVSKKGIGPDTPPTVACGETQAENLVGYSSPIEFVGGKVLVVSQYGSYLNASSWASWVEKNSPTDTDSKAILSALTVMLDPDAMTRNTSVTNMSMYRTLESEVSKTIDEIEAWGKKMKQMGASADMDQIGKTLLAGISEERTDSLSMGRELGMEYQDSPDFFSVLRKQLGYVRAICGGAIGLQTVINNSNRHPYFGGKR